MKVSEEGLVKILYRRFKFMYTKERIAEIIESEGAKFFDNNIEYLGHGEWLIK